MRAVITAGARIDGAYARNAGTQIKALAPVRGTTMLSRAITAARGVGADAIAVVGGEGIRAACGADVERFVAEGESGAENVRRALRAWPDDETLLYVTSDLPYIDTASLADFLSRAGEELAMALVDAEDFERSFPGAPAFGIRLAGERVVNGGAFLVPAGAAGKVASLATRFFEARKQPWRMARIAGLDLLTRFALGALSVAAIERRAQRVLGLPVRAVRGCAPELAFDADTDLEYRYACEHR